MMPARTRVTSAKSRAALAEMAPMTSAYLTCPLLPCHS